MDHRDDDIGFLFATDSGEGDRSRAYGQPMSGFVSPACVHPQARTKEPAWARQYL